MSYIRLNKVSVEIPIYSGFDRSLKFALLRPKGGPLPRSAGGTIARDRRNRLVIRALDDVTLSLEDGDRVALLGHNGAGKTTLLRVLADVMEPLSGSVEIAGRVSTLFNITGLLDPELTGQANVFFAGGLLGIPQKRLKAVLPEIVAFSELGDYIRMPVRTYSTGMQVRLGFAIATSIEPDILLIDEVIGAGDMHFVEKAVRRARDVYNKSSIVVVASHAPDFLKEFCNKAILLERGRIAAMGPLDTVSRLYEESGKTTEANGTAISE